MKQWFSSYGKSGERPSRHDNVWASRWPQRLRLAYLSTYTELTGTYLLPCCPLIASPSIVISIYIPLIKTGLDEYKWIVLKATTITIGLTL